MKEAEEFTRWWRRGLEEGSPGMGTAQAKAQRLGEWVPHLEMKADKLPPNPLPLIWTLPVGSCC